MNRRITLTASAAALAAAVALISCGRGDAGGAIRVSGNIETNETQISFRVPGRMAVRLVDEGDAVKAGQVVARLDSTDLNQQVALRQADADAAAAALKELQDGYRKEDVAQARARLDAAEAEESRLKADDARQQDLFKREVISAREYDASHAALLTAQAQQRAAAEQYALMKSGYRSEQIDQARARLDAANQALDLAKTQLGYATAVSPLSGVVLSKNAEPGEVLAAGAPVVTVGDIRKVYLRAYIDEADLGRVKLGQEVKVTTDSYPGKVYKGRIVFISPEAEFTPKMVQTQRERVKLVYRIKIDISNPDQELKPGMPADGEIGVGRSS
jgi:HlyD family secretion protein